MSREVTQLRAGAKTDVGQKRDLNEDDFTSVEQFRNRSAWPIAEEKGNLYIVADGMGGHNAGEVASRLAVDIISDLYYDHQSADVEGSLREAIEEANRQIHDRARNVLAEAGMGSTVVAAVIRGDDLFVGHAGDSRAYLVREGQIYPLTQDHSWVSEQLAQGLITPEEARKHPYRSYITRSLGINPEVDVDTGRWKIGKGDSVLLCSDGLTGQVDDETILQVVSDWEPEDACEELVRLANEAGGPDNITAIVVRVEHIVPVLAEHLQAGPVAAAAAAGAEPAPLPGLQHGRGGSTRWLTVLLAAVAVISVLGCIALAAVLWPQNQQLSLQNEQLAAEATDLAGLNLSLEQEKQDLAGQNSELRLTLSVAETALEQLPVQEATFEGGAAQLFTATPLPTVPPAPTETHTPVPADTTEPAPTETASPTATQTGTPTTMPTLTSTPTPTPTTTVTSTMGSSVEEGTAPTPVPQLSVKAARLNIRVLPSILEESLGMVDRGQSLTILGRDPASGWFYVCCVGPNGDLEGWVTDNPDFVELNVPWDSIPEVVPE